MLWQYYERKNAKIIASSCIFGSALHSGCVVYFLRAISRLARDPKQLLLYVQEAALAGDNEAPRTLFTVSPAASEDSSRTCSGYKTPDPTFIFAGPSVSPL